MTFDALALHAVRDELSACAQSGRVQEVFLLDQHSLGLEIYAGQRHYLLASTEASSARVHLVSARLRRGSDAVTPFLLLLRKYVRDGRLETIEQPRLERLLALRVAKRADDGTVYKVRLIIEVMGRRSNVVLVDEDGSILDALKRVPPSRNPSRPLLPHLRYSPPPGQDRLDPLAEPTVACLRDEALGARPGTLLADLIGQRLAGFSPQLAREVAFRVTGAADARLNHSTDWAELRAVLSELLQPLADHNWQPTLVFVDGRAAACAPYPIHHLAGAEVRPAESMSLALERWIADRRPGATQTTTGARAPGPAVRGPASDLLAAHARRRQQLERKRAALERSLDQAGAMHDLRAAGEAILASTATIAPGEEALVWGERSIALDASLTPAENAQRYFEQYRKARDGARLVPELLHQVDLELTYLDEMMVFVSEATAPEQLRALKAELAEAGVMADRGRRKSRQDRGREVRGKHPSARSALVQRVATDQGFEILVGTSAGGNEAVTFELAAPGDLWVHARGMPGAHVVVRCGGRPVPPAVLKQAARLAARHSSAAVAEKVPVDWTERRHVRRQRGGRPGQVTYTREQTLIVTPLQSPELPTGVGRSVS